MRIRVKGSCGVLSKVSARANSRNAFGLLAAYAWEAVEELIEGITGLQVNDKAIYRNPSAREHGGSSHNLKIRVINLMPVHFVISQGCFSLR